MFSQILHVGLQLRFDDLLETMQVTADEIRMNQVALRDLEQAQQDQKEQSAARESTPPPAADKYTLELDLSDNMHTFLYLVVIYTKLESSLDEAQTFSAMQVLHRVCSQLSPREPSTGRSLLHFSVDSDTSVDDFHTSDVVRFPSAAATKALLSAGADPAARCSARGDTPLHRIVAYQRIVSDFATIHSIITDLVDAGAHVDVVNRLFENFPT